LYEIAEPNDRLKINERNRATSVSLLWNLRQKKKKKKKKKTAVLRWVLTLWEEECM
jgi:hypothetical protein